MNDDKILEQLSDLEHEQWMYWSKSIASKEKIGAEKLASWNKDWIPYSQLSEEVKEHDRKWARKSFKIFNKLLSSPALETKLAELDAERFGSLIQVYSGSQSKYKPEEPVPFSALAEIEQERHREWARKVVEILKKEIDVLGN